MNRQRIGFIGLGIMGSGMAKKLEKNGYEVRVWNRSQERARALVAENKDRKAQGQEPRMPEENYYGWLVNDKLPDLQSLF